MFPSLSTAGVFHIVQLIWTANPQSQCVTFIMITWRSSWEGVLFCYPIPSWYLHIHRFCCFRKEEEQKVQSRRCRVGLALAKVRGVSCLQSMANNTLKYVLERVTTEKLKPNLNTISDHARDEKYADFYWIRKYFENSA